MKTTNLQVKNLNSNYSIVIGKNILSKIPGKIKTICPGAKKIALIIDKKIPKKFTTFQLKITLFYQKSRDDNYQVYYTRSSSSYENVSVYD